MGTIAARLMDANISCSATVSAASLCCKSFRMADMLLLQWYQHVAWKERSCMGWSTSGLPWRLCWGEKGGGGPQAGWPRKFARFQLAGRAKTPSAPPRATVLIWANSARSATILKSALGAASFFVRSTIASNCFLWTVNQSARMRATLTGSLSKAPTCIWTRALGTSSCQAYSSRLAVDRAADRVQRLQLAQ